MPRDPVLSYGVSKELDVIYDDLFLLFNNNYDEYVKKALQAREQIKTLKPPARLCLDLTQR